MCDFDEGTKTLKNILMTHDVARGVEKLSFSYTFGGTTNYLKLLKPNLKHTCSLRQQFQS